jgi:hypothetical protein
VIDALKRKMMFLFYVGDWEKWYVFDPADIVKPEVSYSTFRGDVEYLDFNAEKIKKSFQARLSEPKRVR